MEVLNQQAPQRIDRDLNGTLYVHSIFHTIQGEGMFAGRASVFVRLHGCNLQCPGCDTDYTSSKLLENPDSVLRAVDRQAQQSKTRLVVITGGEPFRQNLVPLLRLLIEHMYVVQIETNGSLHYPIPDEVTVVVSPKTPKIHPVMAKRADAYKYVLQRDSVSVDGLPTLALYNDVAGQIEPVARPPKDWVGPIYLQAMDEKDDEANDANIMACVDSVINNARYTLGFQMHKYVNLP